MIAKLAEEIYYESKHLKKYNSNNLFYKKNRLALEKDLYRIRGMVEGILLELYRNTNYSSEYYKLALFMNTTLNDCLIFISKGKPYRSTVQRYIWGFHNLPRAFFSIDNRMRISPDDAMDYFKPYLKLD